MKRIDHYLIRQFVPPFVATFFIALFVLILQILWVYIDDIIGKGSSIWFILEMVFYLSMTLIPLALPIAVLISSVMVMGNLAERYELSSLKSAGVSLARVMRPLLVLVIGVAFFSFISSNYLIPIANLKGKTRLYDVRKQKPNLNLEAGVFNEDFDGYVMYAGRKSDDGRHIYDVMIYTSDYARSFQVITAEKGQLYTTPDQRFMIMELENGYQYQEVEGRGDGAARPFVRNQFGRWEKRFDLGQFNLERTDEGSFRTHSTVLTIAQIREALDSLDVMIADKDRYFRMHVGNYLPVLAVTDTLAPDLAMMEGLMAEGRQQHLEQIYADGSPVASSDGVVVQERPVRAGTDTRLLDTYASRDHGLLLGRSRTMARTILGEAGSQQRIRQELAKNSAKYRLEVHLKFSVALICIIFLFIGAPMGALVRKGGFGYPLLIAIGFFMLFMILNMLFKSLAEKLIISPFLGAWMPAFILFPLGLFLTYRAMIDARIIELDPIIGPIVRLVHRLKKRHEENLD